MKSINEVKNLFNVTCNDYWHYHFTLTDETSAYEPKRLGNQMIESIAINTIIPVLFAYGHYCKEDDYKQKAILWLQEIKAENNNITKQWELYKIENKNAFDSQALIQLTNQYCKTKNCLICAVGNKILK